MSYILEALRKSERQRREVEEQPLARLTAAPPRERSRWRFAILLLSALTNIVVLVYLLAPVGFPDHRTPSRNAAQGEQPKEPAANRKEIPVADGHGVAAEAPVPAKTDAVAPIRAEASPRPAKAKPVPRSSGAKAVSPDRPAKENLQSRATVASAERRSEAISELSEFASHGSEFAAPSPVLPAPSRSAPLESGESAENFPKPKINVYAYTSRVDGDRFVIIQNRKYREGDRIEGGPVVRRIEEQGMTLEFAGRTYRIPRP